MFTDNTTCENSFYKGTSTSPFLFDLVLRLRLLTLKVGMRLHLIHVAGTRMIDQGSDGLSRGLLYGGVMMGKNMSVFYRYM